MYIQDGNAQERNKYSEIWSLEQYQRATSPGAQNVLPFMEVLAPQPGARILDIGCGSGAAGLAFESLGMKVSWLDLTGAGLYPEVDRERFIEAPLWEDWWVGSKTDSQHDLARYLCGWDYGFCCDVMEHLPPEYTMLAIDRMIKACTLTWLQICNLPDEFGKLIGEPLHLTVRPYSWWLLRLNTIAEVVDARDLCGVSMFVVKEKE